MVRIGSLLFTSTVNSTRYSFDGVNLIELFQIRKFDNTWDSVYVSLRMGLPLYRVAASNHRQWSYLSNGHTYTGEW